LCLALDRCTVSIMVVDECNRVIYVNEAAESLLSRYEAQIRADVPEFDARYVVGTDVQLLAGVEVGSFTGLGTRVEHCRLGSVELRVSIQPMVDPQGRHWGAVLEWSDRVPEVSPAGAIHSAEQLSGVGTTASRHMDESLRRMTRLTEEMARKAGRYAQHADQASRVVALARQQVVKQGRIAQEVTASTARWFRQVGDVSRAIGDIIKVVEETASRSRLLLTDTAVAEKSSAAQKDRRITVAEEMLSLATLSVNAAQVAQQLIAGLVRRAADGSELVTRNGGGLGAIFDSLDEASAIVIEVAAVAHEQSQEVLEVSRKIAELGRPKEQSPTRPHNAAAAGDSVVPFKRRVRHEPPT
jgi:methyl-accepting chemotaxis protein